MSTRPLSLAVVGADHANNNKRGPTRRFEIAITKPGEKVRLEREPKNRADERAVAVYSARGVQLGYLTAERAALICPMLIKERTIRAVFQRSTNWGCWIRAAFDGELPSIEGLQTISGHDVEQDWWPDETYDDD